MILDILKLQAFGPFKNEFKVDFNDLNKQGIFLLTGDTGVGKTSIFDAISYALYGKTSGSNSQIGSADSERIRSDYADETIKTYVELSFYVNDVLYTIHREPRQILLGRGNKPVEKPTNCQLKYGDNIIDRISDIDKKIKDLIGLDIDQFRQIVMIPQGEFIKLLTGKSDEKEAIFRKIFKTSGYSKFEEILKSKSDVLKNNISDINNKINSLLSQIIDGNDEDENVNLRIEKSKNLISELDDNYFLMEKTYKEKKEEYNKLEAELNNLKTKNNLIEEFNNNEIKFEELVSLKDEIDNVRKKIKLSDDAKKIKKIDDQIIEYKSNIKSYEDDIKSKENSIKNKKLELSNDTLIKESLLKQTSEFESKKEELYNLNNVIKNIDHYNSLNDKLESNSQKISDNKKNIKSLEIEIPKLQSYLILNQESLEKINKQIEAEVELVKKQNDLNNELKSLKSYNDITKLNNDLKIESEKLNNDVKDKYDLLESLRLQKEDFESKKLEDFFAIEANKLKDGEPCPLCGAKHHPFKAMQADIEVTDQMISDLDKKIKEEQKSYIDLQAEIKLNSNKFIENDNEIEKLKAEINYFSMDEIKLMLNEIENELKTIKENKDLKVELDNSIKADNIKLNEKNEELKNLNLSNEKLEFECEQAIKDLDKLNIDLNVDYVSKRDNLIEEINKYESDKKLFIDKVAELNTNISLLEKDIASIKDKIFFTTNNLNEKNFERQSYYMGDEYLNDLIEEDKLEELNNRVKKYDEEFGYLKKYLSDHQNLKNYEIIDLKNIEEELNQKNLDNESLNKEIGGLKNKIDNLKDILSKVNILVSNNKKKIDDYEKYELLSRITTGNNNYKMNFEKYILAIYFEEIIDYANNILKQLTDRYILVRKDDCQGGAKQGLDLDVFDYSTCQKRSVKTLSGGESFKAALALALGLSEMIKTNQAVIDINTLFIDEGFGTLDSDSLDSAINMLVGFKDKGLKIGIISHVQELKQRIESRIVVSRDNNGSTIKVIV